MIFGLLLIAAFVVSVPAIRSRSTPASRNAKRRSRLQAERDLRQIEKEIGLRPYSAIESKRMEQEERENYNSIVRSQAFWAGSGSRYVDYDGMLRDGDTDEPIQWVGNKATGKTQCK